MSSEVGEMPVNTGDTVSWKLGIQPAKMPTVASASTHTMA